MKTIFSKLRSNRGSSMVIALILMLVSLMVSRTILAAAATAGRNVKMGDEGQQAYLTVSSAAETYRDAVLSLSKRFKKTEVRSYKTPNDFDQNQNASVATTYVDLPEGTPFSAEIEDALKNVTNYPVRYQKAYRIQVKQKEGAADYEPVCLTLTLEKDENSNVGMYNLTADFSNAIPGAALPAHPYRITVALKAQQTRIDGESGSDTTKLTRTETVTWEIVDTDQPFTRLEETDNGKAN